jgi:hypothetical protein
MSPLALYVMLGGQAKGSTKEAAKQRITTRKEVVKRCATLYNQKKREAKHSGSSIPNGMLKKIITGETEKSGVTTNSISLETVQSRVKPGNLDAFNPSQQSQFRDIKPITCQFCIYLGKMGKPLTKTTIVELANDLIFETKYQKNVRDCKAL